ncbi:MAG: polyribonucleotide nucleotidyltransferase [candidate division WWE3 bacterium]|nr:polyribonucleotide nucleotidyltransferase [candidate division WWE3 bacterium]
MMTHSVKKETEFAGKKLVLEAGDLAFQTNMAVLARYGDTVVLATVVCNEPKMETDFFPLKVDFEERLYAGGYIKNSRFQKREGRPSDEAIITGRLIDHAVRPRFPKDFLNDTHLVVTPLSVEHDGDVETLALLAASTVLHASNVPWAGPLSTVRVGMINGEFILNPGENQFEKLDLNLVMTSSSDKVVAMEMGANLVPEEKVLAAIKFGFEATQPLLTFVDDFAKACKQNIISYVSRDVDHEVYEAVEAFAKNDVVNIICSTYLDRADQTLALATKVYEKFEGKFSKVEMNKALAKLEKYTTRKLILEEKRRPDSRAFDEIRPLSMSIGILPRTHGSALFTRGLTQGLVVTTLGSMSLEQTIENMYGETTKRYMHHYNGPAFSLGEIGKNSTPGRREIGHGMLAEKALLPVIPSKEEFPYAIRVVSEILSQQGSSSMAATCGSSLSLMDAGVPIKAPVAGIAIGIVFNEDETQYQILTDIANFEDFYGFMDFKMTGSKEGVTAIQMDIKCHGLTLQQMSEIIAASRKARLTILDKMAETISVPRTELSAHAPRITTLKIKTDQIGLLIGPGGKTIRDIIARTGATIDVEEDGSVYVAAVDAVGGEQAIKEILAMTHEATIGEEFDATVKKVMDFGAFVEYLPGKEGLVHVSELAYEYIDRIDDKVKVGDKFKVKVVGVNDEGKISLSKKALEPRPEGYVEQVRAPRPPRPSFDRGPRPTFRPRSQGHNDSGKSPYAAS